MYTNKNLNKILMIYTTIYLEMRPGSKTLASVFVFKQQSVHLTFVRHRKIRAAASSAATSLRGARRNGEGQAQEELKKQNCAMWRGTAWSSGWQER